MSFSVLYWTTRETWLYLCFVIAPLSTEKVIAIQRPQRKRIYVATTNTDTQSALTHCLHRMSSCNQFFPSFHTQKDTNTSVSTEICFLVQWLLHKQGNILHTLLIWATKVRAVANQPCSPVPLAMMCGLLAGQKQRLCRTSSAGRRCCARSASSSRAPLTLRMLCWPSSANERLTSSFSHRPNRLPPPLAASVALLPPDLGAGTNGKDWRKLFWKRGKCIKLFELCKQVMTTMKICLFHTIKQANPGFKVSQCLIPFVSSLGSHGTRQG